MLPIGSPIRRMLRDGRRTVLIERESSALAEEVVVGFDAREMSRDLGELWPPERRALYLLRLEVEKPLSVDRAVWPTVLAKPAGPLGLWESDDAVNRELRRQGSPDAYWIVSLALHTAGLSDIERRTWTPFLVSVDPDLCDSWTLLGYDVADLALTSGLMNCGYDGKQVEGLRTKWGPKLNASHLFSTADAAQAFARMTDKRVPEHAPFFVYGLYLVARSSEALR